MFNKKSLLKKFAVLGIAMLAPAMMHTPVMAATKSVPTKSVPTENVLNINPGTLSNDLASAIDIGSSKALAYGPITQYPVEGGTWEYGFWNAKVRSYYTVDCTHGSTVKLGDKTSRSIDTASGKPSRAELWAVQTPGGDDHYYYRVS